MIKSRPLYQPLELDPSARARLIVSDLAEIPDHAIAAGMTLPGTEIWVVRVPAPGIAEVPAGGLRAFRAVADLLSHLRQRLRRETVGLRLYGVGTEAFLWDTHNAARGAGLGEGEIFLTQAGSLRRRVYCTHCKAINETVTTSITRCLACGVNLFVRDHFSRRLAAFMGVSVDAEVPGQVPVPELLYP